ncbi:MAG TPA: ABC transporter permease subunit [Clostridia bacterium]|nr:ABC transporter permease subunit [Clostridia bacterium]
MKKTILFIMGACITIPLIFLFLWSLTQRLQWPNILPQQLSLNTWQQILGQKEFILSLAISLGISISVTLLAMAVSLPAAFAISQYAFKGRTFIWIMLLMPLIIPSISISIGLHLVYLKWGLTDTFIGVVLCQLIPTVPYAIKILTSNFDLLGRGLGEQAKILGANTFDVILHIYLPNMKPALSLSAVLVFIVSFSQYLLTFLIGGGTIKTLPILLFPVMQSGNRSEVSVYSMVFILTAMIATFLIERYLSGNNKNDYYINL